MYFTAFLTKNQYYSVLHAQLIEQQIQKIFYINIKYFIYCVDIFDELWYFCGVANDDTAH